MTHSEIREKFLKFFSAKGGPATGGEHRIVPSSSLLPTDPSVLFTTAGMQQFKDYYTGKANAMKDFGSLNTVSIQKSMRTSDIDEVGDESHLTFFEMLGNFSFGGYWKKEAISYAHEFITKEMGLKIDCVSVFGGEDNISADDESEQIWKSIDSSIEVKRMGRSDNFWGPTGDEGPCGPTTEIYVNGVEIWNVVFNEYYCNKDKSLTKLEKPGIDTGMGLERLAMVVQGKKNIFETDLFEPIFKLTPSDLDIKIKRIISDHSRSVAFLLSCGVRPSNKEQGYVLRRLMRRVINHLSGSDTTLTHDIFAKIVEIYGQSYPNLNTNTLIYEFDHEKEKFDKTLRHGLKELERLSEVDAQSAFRLYESFGLPFEIIKDVAGEKAKSLTREAFDEKFKKHQEKSRAGAEKKFGGHGLLMDTGELKVPILPPTEKQNRGSSISQPNQKSDLGEIGTENEEELKKATRLHTATHLLHASLRKILGTEVHQAGSDITPERLRFDFTFSRKVTPEEIKQVEDLVNEAIQKDYPVTKEEMSYEDAIKSGAMAFFKLKYPPRVNVYSVGDFSKELCGGPHVSHSAEIGKLKITKEEAVSAGVRRIRATVD